MRKLIIGNWKLNPITLKEAQGLAENIDKHPKHEAVICPPVLFLSQIYYPNLGAQDVFWNAKGAFTGQVSPATLKSFNVRYCLVGHSEKRSVGESDEQVNLKIKALIQHKIIPVLCIGFGTSVENDDLEVIDVLKDQLKLGLKGVDSTKIVVAYEPVWAISQGNSFGHKTATPEHAEKIALFIKTKYKVGRVLYGGSVNSTNAEGFLQQRNIDGLLVGGASLLPEDFNKIINT